MIIRLVRWPSPAYSRTVCLIIERHFDKVKEIAVLHYGDARHNWHVTFAQYQGALKVRIFGNRNY